MTSIKSSPLQSWHYSKVAPSKHGIIVQNSRYEPCLLHLSTNPMSASCNSINRSNDCIIRQAIIFWQPVTLSTNQTTGFNHVSSTNQMACPTPLRMCTRSAPLCTGKRKCLESLRYWGQMRSCDVINQSSIWSCDIINQPDCSTPMHNQKCSTTHAQPELGVLHYACATLTKSAPESLRYWGAKCTFIYYCMIIISVIYLAIKLS